MTRTGFDGDKYLEEQSKYIKERINSGSGRLYLEFGGKPRECCPDSTKTARSSSFRN